MWFLVSIIRQVLLIVFVYYVVACDADVVDSADLEDGAGGSLRCSLCYVGNFDGTEEVLLLYGY